MGDSGIVWGIFILPGGLLYSMRGSYITWRIYIYYGGFPYNMGDSGMVTCYEIDGW